MIDIHGIHDPLRFSSSRPKPHLPDLVSHARNIARGSWGPSTRGWRRGAWGRREVTGGHTGGEHRLGAGEGGRKAAVWDGSYVTRAGNTWIIASLVR